MTDRRAPGQAHAAGALPPNRPPAPPQRPAQRTLPGIAPPPPPARQPPDSGPPLKVEFAGFKGELRPRLARKLLSWLVPLVLGAGGGVVGKTGRDAVAEQARATEVAELRAKLAAVTEQLARVETTTQLADAKANRALTVSEPLDARAAKDELAVDRLDARVGTLERQRPLVVRAER
ncbi:MAG TPA: hypothetical protein VFV10_14260 [Gammaproteobacteria bacterium]|nr:hypothetical protein [Gammaproteobacteria bacterium]